MKSHYFREVWDVTRNLLGWKGKCHGATLEEGLRNWCLYINVVEHKSFVFMGILYNQECTYFSRKTTDFSLGILKNKIHILLHKGASK